MARGKLPAKIQLLAEKTGVVEVRDPVTDADIDNLGRLQSVRS